MEEKFLIGNINLFLIIVFLFSLETSGDGQISYDEMMNFLETTVRLIFFFFHSNAKRNSCIFLFKKKYQATGLPTNFVPEAVATQIYAMFNLNKEQKINKQQFVEG